MGLPQLTFILHSVMVYKLYHHPLNYCCSCKVYDNSFYTIFLCMCEVVFFLCKKFVIYVCDNMSWVHYRSLYKSDTCGGMCYLLTI